MESQPNGLKVDEPIVLINIGWMKEYKGPDNDPTIGGHGYLKTHKMGHEAWNFEPIDGRLYGYIPGSSEIKLRRIGGATGAERLDGITVVWIARDPEKSGRTKVVGWYRAATVHKNQDHHRMVRDGIDLEYQIDAPADQATLLSNDQRVHEVPTKKVKGNMGQSPVWYGNDLYLKGLRAYIAQAGAPFKTNKSSGKAPHQLDPEERKRIELAAVRHATDYYESVEGGSRVVRSVERDNEGWDLNVTVGTETLRVEVKGLSGTNVCVELTPNEYEMMQSVEIRATYVVYVVTQAGTSGATSHVFYYHAELSKPKALVWQARDGRTLKIEPRVAARLSAVSPSHQ